MDASMILQATMHAGSQSLLVPTMVCLVVLTLGMAMIVGSLLVETLTERRHFKLNNRAAVVAIHDAGYDEVAGIIAESALLRYQKELLIGVVGNMGLPDEELYALSQNELAKSDRRYQHRLNLTDTAAKVAPMLGLMGTLIPLGPGIVAMGRGDVATLSSSLLVAFDTTILGLVAAIVAMLVSRVRKTWYADYATMMRTLSTCLVEKAQAARDEGVQLDYGFIDAKHSKLPGNLERLVNGGAALPAQQGAGARPNEARSEGSRSSAVGVADRRRRSAASESASTYAEEFGYSSPTWADGAPIDERRARETGFGGKAAGNGR